MSTKTTEITGQVDYSIDRKTAAKLLKISVRTLDRYIRADRLSIKKEDGRIWLSKSEIIGFRSDKEQQKARRILDKKDIEESIDIINEKLDSSSVKLSSHGHSVPNQSASDSVYKALYDEAKKELIEQRKRLEGANYRVGQLEAELKGSVPLLEYQKYQQKLLETSDDIKLRLEKSKHEYKEVYKKYQIEKYNKFIYLTILFVLLALQPLWLIFAGK